MDELLLKILDNSYWKKSMKSIDLSCSHITAVGLESVCKCFPNLQSLDLSYCTFLTDDALSSLVTLRHLRKLNFHGCFGLSNQAIKSCVESLQQHVQSSNPNTTTAHHITYTDSSGAALQDITSEKNSSVLHYQLPNSLPLLSENAYQII